MFESNCRSLEVFLTLLMVICSRNLTVAYVQRFLFVYIFLKVLSDSNLTQCSCLLLPPVIGGTEMCLVLLIYDVTFFFKSSRGPPWSCRKKRTKEGRQYIFIYVLIQLLALMPPLEAFVFFSVNFCRMYALKKK